MLPLTEIGRGRIGGFIYKKCSKVTKSRRAQNPSNYPIMKFTIQTYVRYSDVLSIRIRYSSPNTSLFGKRISNKKIKYG